MGWHRLLNLTGGQPPSKVGFEAEEELNACYFHLPDAELIRLGKEYSASYVLTVCDESRDIPLVFSNATYCAYKPAACGGLQYPDR
jgi:hypothetical protein